ncbi:MAG: 1-acyl-sn-glycerol-3-phosphate acyltransferase [Trueperaceae bacterium]|nr:MAG: 1-acyl-sn-glycerol-3-phosphate acyltransferase [Trueperaceae bacterium]
MSRPPGVPLIPRGPWLYRLGYALSKALVSVAFGLRVVDVEHVPLDGPCVIASNHDSGWDPPVVGVATPRFLQFMAKRELFSNRLMAWALRGVGTFPVDRGKNDIGAVKEALRRLQAGGAVGVFFEGTRKAESKAAMGGAAYLAQRSGGALVPAAIWREGRRFHVRFGEPLRPTGRSRDETAALTAALTERVRSLLSQQPGAAQPAPADDDADDDAKQG